MLGDVFNRAAVYADACASGDLAAAACDSADRACLFSRVESEVCSGGSCAGCCVTLSRVAVDKPVVSRCNIVTGFCACSCMYGTGCGGSSPLKCLEPRRLHSRPVLRDRRRIMKARLDLVSEHCHHDPYSDFVPGIGFLEEGEEGAWEEAEEEASRH